MKRSRQHPQTLDLPQVAELGGMEGVSLEDPPSLKSCVFIVDHIGLALGELCPSLLPLVSLHFNGPLMHFHTLDDAKVPGGVLRCVPPLQKKADVFHVKFYRMATLV